MRTTAHHEGFPGHHLQVAPATGQEDVSTFRTAGLVTMEDLLEEIVGPIFDEYDPQERPAPVRGGPMLEGGMPISDFNNEYGTELDDADYNTIGGYVFGQLGRLPRSGDRVIAGPYTLEVAEMDGRRVKTIRLHPPAPAPAPMAEEVKSER